MKYWNCVFLFIHEDPPEPMLLFLLLLTATGAAEGTRKVCFGELGCFSNAGPFNDARHRPLSPLPESPAEVGTEFVLYSRKHPSSGAELRADDPGSLTGANINGTLPFKFVVHGFKGYGKTVSFFERFKKAFLARADVNVVLVQWVKGASLPYWQAVSNTRVVGAQLAALILFLQEKLAGFDVANVHLIGHSLGAHVCGYAGKRVRSRKIARITGLDPAGPFFRGTKAEVRLDRGDAVFVDTVNTNGGSIGKFKLGIFYPIGHANFYVNGGRTQAGCHLTVRYAFLAWYNLMKGKKQKMKGVIKKFSCSHTFAHRIFEYAISPLGRPLTAYKCATYRRFLAGDCLDCSRPGRCVPFGLEAKKPEAPANFYFQTGIRPRFSGTHFSFTFVISSGVKKHTGRFFVRFNYESGTSSDEMVLPGPKKWFQLQSGRTMKSLAFLPGQMKAVKSLIFLWRRHKSPFKPTSWWGNGKAKFERVEVFNAKTQEKTTFCSRETLRAKKTYKMTTC